MIPNESVAGVDHTTAFLQQIRQVADLINGADVDALATMLASVRESGGRLFIVGVGGSAANASHAATDFRALAGFEAYCPTDNVATFSAAINDLGWDRSISSWLERSRLSNLDCVLILSVGGGSREPEVSVNIVEAVEFARSRSAIVAGIVGPEGGQTWRLGTHVIRVPVIEPRFVTTHTEVFQAVIWHLLVTHPKLGLRQPHWESIVN